jgi:sugar phosphate isomerase/epimerase
MSISDRLGCSTISFRHLELPQALAVIEELGFGEIDLGALPGVCDHVPYVLDGAAVRRVSSQVRRSPMRVRSVNGDVGDLNAVLDRGQQQSRLDHLDRLLELTAEIGAVALVLPNGALSHQPLVDLETDVRRVAAELIAAAERASTHGLELWVESLHILRLCHSLRQTIALTEELAGTSVGVVMDFSHVVASGGHPEGFVALFGDRIRHVHCRDATLGNIHHSIGNGSVDFAAGIRALETSGFAGHYALELETRDVTDAERPAATVEAAAYISSLLPGPALSVVDQP